MSDFSLNKHQKMIKKGTNSLKKFLLRRCSNFEALSVKTIFKFGPWEKKSGHPCYTWSIQLLSHTQTAAHTHFLSQLSGADTVVLGRLSFRIIFKRNSWLHWLLAMSPAQTLLFTVVVVIIIISFFFYWSLCNTNYVRYAGS